MLKKELPSKDKITVSDGILTVEFGVKKKFFFSLFLIKILNKETF